MQIQPGTQLGSYEIVSQLGAGGMGEVYRARDPKLERDVAIKVLPPDFADDPERLARFEREAKSLAALNHPNIATVHGFEKDGSTHFLVMELAAGEDLAERLKRGPLSIEDAIPLFLQIAEGLEAAHEKGIIHRDLKPANIMVSEGGRAKILDFGLAKASESAGQGVDLSNSPTMTAATMHGAILGTAAYMSPEQARGKSIDKRTDVWAFGVCLFESLVGRRLFRGDDASMTLAAVLTSEPDWDRLSQDVPIPLVRLLRRCLQKDPSRRLRDVADARLELLDLGGLDPSEFGVGRVEPSSNVARWGAALVLTAAVAAAIGWLMRAPPEQSDAGVTRLTVHLPEGEVIADRPAISSDGRTLAYISRNESGETSLFVRRLDEFGPRLLVSGVEEESYTAFSPDGQWLLFRADGWLSKIQVDGGAAVRLARATGHQVWLEDDTIVFIEEWDGGLRSIPAAGGPVETLTIPEAPATYAHNWPQPMLGNRELLFTTWGRDYGASIYSIEGRSWRPLLLAGSADDPGSFGLTASGHLLMLGVPGKVLAGVLAEGQPMPSTTVLTEVQGRFHHRSKWMSISENGTLVYAPGDTSKRRLVWVDREGQREIVTTDTGAFENIAISPDGRAVAFSDFGEVSILDLERGTRQPLLLEPADPGAANQQWASTWLPNSRTLVFASNHLREWDLYFFEQDAGGKVTPIPMPDSQSAGASFNDDGVAAFHAEDSVWIKSRDEMPVEFISGPSLPSQTPHFSPSGRLVAFQSTESGRSEVYITNFPDREQTLRVSIDGGRYPRWSRDGSELFYVVADRLMAVSIREDPLVGGVPGALFQAHMDGDSPYDVHPDGERFLVVEVDPDLVPNRLHVVLNWFEELERLVPTR